MRANTPDAPGRSHPAAFGHVARQGRRLLGAYSGEHGVYGVVLVSALIGLADDDEPDLDILVFLVGTVLVFWLAHVYAAVVAGRAARPPERLGAAVVQGARHSSGMVVAMLIPAALLSLGATRLLNETVAYWLALCSGVVVLGVIGYLNAVRNGSGWRWQVGGSIATALLGVVVIGLSILTH